MLLMMLLQLLLLLLLVLLLLIMMLQLMLLLLILLPCICMVKFPKKLNNSNSLTFWETLPFVLFMYGKVSQKVILSN